MNKGLLLFNLWYLRLKILPTWCLRKCLRRKVTPFHRCIQGPRCPPGLSSHVGGFCETKRLMPRPSRWQDGPKIHHGLPRPEHCTVLCLLSFETTVTADAIASHVVMMLACPFFATTWGLALPACHISFPSWIFYQQFILWDIKGVGSSPPFRLLPTPGY